jgi:hypothetical protein
MYAFNVGNYEMPIDIITLYCLLFWVISNIIIRVQRKIAPALASAFGSVSPLPLEERPGVRV